LNRDKVDLDDLKEVPCQAQIHYTSISGHKFMRVLTRIQALTKDRNIAESKADVRVIHSMAAQKSAALVQQGKYDQAQSYNRTWANYMENNSNYASSEVNQVYVQKQKKFRKANLKKNMGMGIKEKLTGFFNRSKAKKEDETVGDEFEEKLSDYSASDDECENVLQGYKKGL
jgi:hypothetical protein